MGRRLAQPVCLKWKSRSVCCGFFMSNLGLADMSGDGNDSVIGTELVVFEAWVNQVVIEHGVV